MGFRATLLLLLVLGVAPAQDSNRAAKAVPLLSVPPAPVDSFRFDRNLPEVDIKDVQGRVWRRQDFLGKFTLVYVWKTFEARSVDARSGRGHDRLLTKLGFPDLPEVQRFYDRAKGTTKLQVLTFCRDYDYTHAPEYMKQSGFQFPVVADWKLTDQVLGPDALSIRYAVIGPEGKLSTPFRSWSFGRLLFELEAAVK